MTASEQIKQLLPAKKKKNTSQVSQICVTLPNKSRTPRMCARRKGTHPVHANLTVKFIYTWARGNASPKEIHDSITAGQPPGLVKKGPERVRDTALYPSTWRTVCWVLPPSPLFFGTPLFQAPHFHLLLAEPTLRTSTKGPSSSSASPTDCACASYVTASASL